MFVCHGNICRSTMAEFVMKDLVRKAGLADKFIINLPLQVVKKSAVILTMAQKQNFVR